MTSMNVPRKANTIKPSIKVHKTCFIDKSSEKQQQKYVVWNKID